MTAWDSCCLKSKARGRLASTNTTSAYGANEHQVRVYVCPYFSYTYYQPTLPLTPSIGSRVQLHNYVQKNIYFFLLHIPIKRNVTAEYYHWVDFVLMGQYDNQNLQCFALRLVSWSPGSSKILWVSFAFHRGEQSANVTACKDCFALF